MPWDALPDHLNTPEEVEKAFPDDSQYGNSLFGKMYKWVHKKTKSWFVFSYRCKNILFRWRKYPKVLFAIAGEGYWRFEGENGESSISTDGRWYILNEDFSPDYLSRIQYYTRWHIAIQWPLMISIHWYPKASDVPVPGEPRPDSDGKVWYAYWNHFDADLVYWMFVSAFVGRTWK